MWGCPQVDSREGSKGSKSICKLKTRYARALQRPQHPYCSSESKYTDTEDRQERGQGCSTNCTSRYVLCGGGPVAALRSQTLAHRTGPGHNGRELQRDLSLSARSTRTFCSRRASLPGSITRAFPHTSLSKMDRLELNLFLYLRTFFFYPD